VPPDERRDGEAEREPELVAEHGDRVTGVLVMSSVPAVMRRGLGAWRAVPVMTMIVHVALLVVPLVAG
jgi:hypothetical protein